MISRARVGEALFELALFHQLGFRRRASVERERDSPLIVDICGRNIGGTRFKGVYGDYKEVVKTIKITLQRMDSSGTTTTVVENKTLSQTHPLTQISFLDFGSCPVLHL